MMVAFLLVFVHVVIGYALLLSMARLVNVWQRVALAGPLGFTVMSFVIFLISLISTDVYGVQALLLLLLCSTLAAVIALFICQSSVRADYFALIKRLRAFRMEEWLVTTLLLVMGGGIFVLNLSWGPYDWDVMTLYDFRGRVLAKDHQLDQLLAMSAGDADRFTYYYSYPLMTSIVHAMFYALGSSQVMIFYSLTFVSFNALAYIEMFKSTKHPVIRLPMYGLILFSPLFFVQAQTAYTNFPYTYFYSFGVLHLFRTFSQKQSPILASVLLAAAIWIRYVDPFYYIVALLILIQAVVHRRPSYLLTLLPMLVVRQTWAWYLTTHVAVYSQLIQVFTPESIWQTIRSISPEQLFALPEVVWFVMKIYFQHLGWVTAALCIVVALLDRHRQHKYWFAGTWFIATMMIVMAGSFLFSLIYKDWSGIPGSAERMFSSLQLILYVMLVQGIDDWFNQHDKTH